ncbi:6-carboxytetrahydropterin synthase [uncultured Salinisphaera sp.]|uniref:6-pyruvoyl trahydropterin synthase family protein n=1 Tax=uncultured Salinisphaera sp. TaxID=359372 RepID=UPI0032B1AE27
MSQAAADSVTLFVEHVTHIDCGVLDPSRGLRGATWLVDAELTGTRDDQGMLFDFGPAKKLLKSEIDALVDHRLLVPRQAPGITRTDDGVALTTHEGDHYDYRGPAEALTDLDMAEITPERLADWLGQRVARQLPANVDSLSLTLRAEIIDGPVYDYTHGLSAHDGNCQRLAHGHRCRLAVWLDDQERADIAQAFAARWQGIFIGSREHLTTPADATRLGFAYDAPQGHFAIELDAAHCALIDGPATVENIADAIARRLAVEHTGHRVTVKAYEGVGKGAVVSHGRRASALPA